MCCCLLFDVSCLLLVVCSLLRVDRCSLFVVRCCLLCVACRFFDCCVLFGSVRCLLLCLLLLFVVCCLLRVGLIKLSSLLAAVHCSAPVDCWCVVKSVYCCSLCVVRLRMPVCC